MDDRPVFLIGFMGSGKTTLGRRLAERLGWDFVDTDEQIEEREALSIERIFQERGEQRFRDLESEMVAGFGGLKRAVVATGGGLFLRVGNRRRLEAIGRTVWLDVPLPLCAARVGEGAGRPLWLPTDPVALRALFDRRAATYALARYRLRVVRESADELVGRLLGVFD